MKKNLSLSMVTAIMLMGFSACQEENFGYEAKDIAYKTEFIKVFGNPSIDQDWSTVGNVKLIVNVPDGVHYSLYITSQRLTQPAEVNILYAQYDDLVSDGQPYRFDFDYPEGCDHAYVSLLEEGSDRFVTRTAVITANEAEVSFDQLVASSAAPTADVLPKLRKSAYIIAFEDLGGTCDWDFNDAVFSLSHVVGQSDVTIQLLAAGGTLPVQLQMNGSAITFGDKTDIHEAFGVNKDVRVNVISENEEIKTQVVEAITSQYQLRDANMLMSTLLGQLSLSVVQSDGTVSNIAAPCNYIDKTTVGANIPQAILIAKLDWQWPAEGQRIDEVYPEFPTWVADADLGNTWYGKAWFEEEDDDVLHIGAEDAETPIEAQAKARQ